MQAAMLDLPLREYASCSDADVTYIMNISLTVNHLESIHWTGGKVLGEALDKADYLSRHLARR